ncbi:MAG TPA: LuxR C-terminal-related transcriptional regulator [Methylomirabilota bacterium]|nr:LuxR C-terminal-related transcriptional regulator [Methylomirabilota bacterium]
MSISERTVDSHVRIILNKLGFNSRAQIAAWIASGNRLNVPGIASTPPPTRSTARRRS